MKIAYITVTSPFGRAEAFFIPELKEMLKQGADLTIFPFRAEGAVVHQEAQELLKYTHVSALLSLGEVTGFLSRFFRHPLNGIKVIFDVINNSRSVRLKLKNLATIPKGFYFADLFENMGIDFIYAQWASTPSTAAYIAARLTSIPWSFTAHRWDIPENNLIEEKVASSSFARAIDNNGRNELCALLKDRSLADKVHVLYMGVTIPPLAVPRVATTSIFTILCPAFLMPKKGHKYLFEACKMLAEKGMGFRCLVAGNGPLESDLKGLVRQLGLEDKIEFLGMVPNDKIKEMYSKCSVDLVVLPSIVTDDGELEGIPVALMEAMSYGVPVISTDTGGIPELVADAGIVIPQRDALAIANAISMVQGDREMSSQMQIMERQKIMTFFNVHSVVTEVLKKIAAAITCA